MAPVSGPVVWIPSGANGIVVVSIEPAQFDNNSEDTMPKFLIERNFAEQLELEDWRANNPRIEAVNDEVGVRWIYSFLSADKRKTYCLYEAPNAEAIREAARKANVPADVITPVDEVTPAMFA
ncbi:DUF4242 domain-containing protein [Acuticoccus sediminis]|uniref:DUF4242 domain-containing protein n=1 Tax=Acuticoccus sediminis TaxID=2184697 RepID=UPI001CFCF2E5|nr:DUF4242 domain-containing protein [Acuticoccus sediminis]